MKKTVRPDIAIFLPALLGGGAERVMVNLARGFYERGYRVDIVLAKAEGPYLDLVPEGVRVVDFGLERPGVRRLPRVVPQLLRYLRRNRPPALLAGLEHANLVALWSRALARTDTRVVISVHNTLSQKVFITWRMRTLLRWTYPWTDAAIAVSQGVATDLTALTGLAADKIQVVYNPVLTSSDLSVPPPDPPHPWLNGPDPLIIGMGRLIPQKDFATLVSAFARLRATTNAKLLILGEGPEREALLHLAERLGVRNDVALPGFVSTPRSYLAAADLFVLSSRWEGFGNVIVEAFSVGTPVVATDCPNGPREILANGRYGHLARVADPDDLAAKMRAALTEPSDHNALIRRARDFTLDAILPQYLEIVLGTRSASRPS